MHCLIFFLPAVILPGTLPDIQSYIILQLWLKNLFQIVLIPMMIIEKLSST